MFRNAAVRYVLVGILVITFAWPASAQVITTPGHIRQSATGAAAGFRAPGNMVVDALSRASANTPKPLSIIEITELPKTSVGTQALVDTINLLFQQVNTAIVAFHNLLKLRAGQ